MIFGKLFSKDDYKKYDDIFSGARRMGQSVDNAFRQAFSGAVNDKKFQTNDEAVRTLGERLLTKCLPEDQADLKKAIERYKD